MSHIKSRKHATPSLRSAALPVTTLAAGLALATATPVFAQTGMAQDDQSPQQRDHHQDEHRGHDHRGGERNDGGPRELDKVEVRGLRSFVVSPKFTQTLQDTPQTIQVISKEELRQQGATTLTEALRNSPGVGTFYAGENGATSTGDTLYMRGFDSSSSIFVDGARDLGSISRDLFNIEQVEVVKGPAGTDTGRSAPTGAINMVTKQAMRRNATSGTVSIGDEGQKRVSADWNQRLGATGAFRLNAMWQDSDAPGRDRVNNSRWGLAPSLGFGLGIDSRVWLNLLYVKQDNVPDDWVPTIGLPHWTPQPGLQQLAGHPIDPKNYFGSPLDHDNVTAQMATLRFEHDFSGALKLSNTLRWGKTMQDYFITSFMTTGGTSANPLAGNIKWTNINDLSTYTLLRSNFNTKDQQNKILTDQLNLRADFSTGAVDHFLSAGMELTREEQTAWSIATSGSLPPISLYHPDWQAAGAGTVTYGRSGAIAHGKTDTSALYLFDTLKFGEHFLMTAGVRVDHYTTAYDATVACTTVTPLPRGSVACPAGTANGSIIPSIDLRHSGTLLNWKVGLVYKPVEVLSLYTNFALSQQPPGGANFALNTTANSADNIDNAPQQARTSEIGAKWDVNHALTANLALFQTTVSNEIAPDTTSPSGYSQTGKKKVKGVEASIGGNITKAWNISLGYLYQKATVEQGTIMAQDGSNTLTYTPANAFTSWTTYRFPFGLTIGGGVRYTAGLHKGTDGAAGTPSFTNPWTVVDAMASYDINRHLTLRLNGYNLGDKKYVAAINKSGYRYTPGAPRTFLLSADFRF
ncbi:MAG: catecholate siderophore receptor Fiu [Proteobacteria bacterium]|nr:catecholate siderophore receptor Fiu [Pseudomonadota bacterium]